MISSAFCDQLSLSSNEQESTIETTGDLSTSFEHLTKESYKIQSRLGIANIHDDTSSNSVIMYFDPSIAYASRGQSCWTQFDDLWARRKRRSHHVVLAAKNLAALNRIRSRYAKDDHNQLETSWLVANRRAYAGQWVALQGNRLLAHSSAALEVFAVARGINPKPLVMLIEQDETPFAGW